MKIKSIEEKPLSYLKSFHITYEDKKGQPRIWEVASRGSKERLEKEIQGEIFSDGAMIVAWDDKKEHVLMVREFRVISGHDVISFPAGLNDKDEDILTTAVREFKEETGLDLLPEGIDRPRYTSVGLSNERVYTVFGRFSGQISTAYQEDSERILPFLVDRKKAIELLEKEDVTIRSAFILRGLFSLPLYEKL
ncbi:MAG TPA: NUDIX hydrolase [Clostridia bacterium]|nr:NUDIX hydrolase [Clostridia bacterium]